MRVYPVFCVFLAMASAQTIPPPQPIWAGTPPGSLGSAFADSVYIWAYPAAGGNNNGAAVVFCPGGGYASLATDKEGHAPARWFQARGLSAFVLKYRLGSGGYRHPVEMQDAQRAMRWVRSNAARYQIDRRRVGIAGFSAGGHLASTVGTHFDVGNPTAVDTVERQSCRPDFLLLIYPVITMNSLFTHAGSRQQLLGTTPSQALVNLLSNELQVTPQTPPSFLVHGTNDATVPVRNSEAFYDSCRSKNVPARYIVLANGPHGFGLADGQFGAPVLAVARTWPDSAMAWLGRQGMLVPTSIAPGFRAGSRNGAAEKLSASWKTRVSGAWRNLLGRVFAP